MAENNSELIRQKQSQRRGYQSSKSTKESTREANNEKLDRLYRVKGTIEMQKGYADERYKSIKAYVEDAAYSSGWTGSKADATKGNISENIVIQYKAYVNSIDTCLDGLCDTITQIENENKQLSWDIFRLGSLINSLGNEIEKLFN